MNVLKNFFIIAYLSLLTLTGCVSTKSPEVEFKGQSDEQIYTTGHNAFIKNNYTKAIHQFEGLAELYPFSAHTEQANYELVTAYYENANYNKTIDAANEFIKRYPANANIDTIYYLKAKATLLRTRNFSQRYLPIDMSSRDLSSAKEAYEQFIVFTQKFPHSALIPRVQKNIAYLNNLFAQHEIHIAHFYLKRHAYVGSANRASKVTHSSEAQQILNQSYTALKINNS